MEKKEKKSGNKKYVIIAILLLLMSAGLTTFAIYKGSATGTATVSTAAFVVKANNTNITSQSFTFSLSDVTWSNNPSKVAGKIAPGASGTIPLVIDATGSQVNVAYTVTVTSIKVDGTTISNDAGFTATPANASGTIAYSTASNAMKLSSGINVAWTATDSSTKNAADLDIAGKTVEIAVTVTAQQAAA